MQFHISISMDVVMPSVDHCRQMNRQEEQGVVLPLSIPGSARVSMNNTPGNTSARSPLPAHQATPVHGLHYQHTSPHQGTVSITSTPAHTSARSPLPAHQPTPVHGLHYQHTRQHQCTVSIASTANTQYSSHSFETFLSCSELEEKH